VVLILSIPLPPLLPPHPPKQHQHQHQQRMAIPSQPISTINIVAQEPPLPLEIVVATGEGEN
jgi:hypothetical protein